MENGNNVFRREHQLIYEFGDTKSDILKLIAHYLLWLASSAFAILTGVLLRTLILAIISRMSDNGYWATMRLNLLDRVLIILVSIGIVILIVAAEHYLNDGLKKGNYRRRAGRIFGLQLLIFGSINLAVILISGAAGGSAAIYALTGTSFLLGAGLLAATSPRR